MQQTATKTENGSSIRALESNGTPAASTDSERGIIKVCKHAFCGCISAKGYTCTHTGPCEPMDENGRRFEVRYTTENGQRFMHKVRPAMRIPEQIIDADAALADTPFADAKPFDAGKFVTDVIGS